MRPLLNMGMYFFKKLLLESNMLVLNGRVTPQFDNFTSVSVKESAIMDYIAAPHCSLSICKSFKVHLALGAMEYANVYNKMLNKIHTYIHTYNRHG